MKDFPDSLIQSFFQLSVGKDATVNMDNLPRTLGYGIVVVGLWFVVGG